MIDDRIDSIIMMIDGPWAGGSAKKGGGGNAYNPQPTPDWQKPLTSFFTRDPNKPSQKEEDEEVDKEKEVDREQKREEKWRNRGKGKGKKSKGKENV